MAVIDALPRISPEVGEGETLGIIPLEMLDDFTLNGTEYGPYAIYDYVLAERLKDQDIITYNFEDLEDLGIVALTQQTDEVKRVHSIVKPRRTIDGFSGYSYNFIKPHRMPLMTVFEGHYFYRRGAEETQSDPTPLSLNINELTVIMDALCGPDAQEHLAVEL